MTRPDEADVPTQDAATASRPIWLLDVDGVLNAVMDPATIPDEYTAVNNHDYAIVYRQSVVDRIASLHESGRVEVRWLTTWMHRANTLARGIGLPEFAVEGDPEVWIERPGTWWKSTVAQRIDAECPAAPLIWTDDDLDYSVGRGEVDWLAGRVTPTLAITTDWRIGLSDYDMDRIESFLALPVVEALR